MGSSKRKDLVSKEAKELPGPGGYDTITKETGPKYTMGTKREVNVRTESPGPGGYEVSHSPSKDRVISYKMGTSNRAEMIQKNA